MRPAPLMPARPRRGGVEGYVSKTDLVAALIRELIITGELAAGGQLRQRRAGPAGFGVSQTQVRRGDAAARIRRGLCRRHPPWFHRGGGRTSARWRRTSRSAPHWSRSAPRWPRARSTSGGLAAPARPERPRCAPADDDPGYADLNREFHFTVYSCGPPASCCPDAAALGVAHGGPRVQRGTRRGSARQHEAILEALPMGMPPPPPPGPTSTSWARSGARVTCARHARWQQTRREAHHATIMTGDGVGLHPRRRGREGAAVHSRVRGDHRSWEPQVRFFCRGLPLRHLRGARATRRPGCPTTRPPTPRSARSRTPWPSWTGWASAGRTSSACPWAGSRRCTSRCAIRAG